MADRHDDVDSWLSERITPLPPPPGTFELIKRRARRRKYRRLAITASSAAVIVAAAVTVPQVVNLPVLSPSPTSGVAAGHPASATPTGAGNSEARASDHVPSPTPSPTPTPPAASVPANFQPSSVTFVGRYTGWVIGQAGTPGHCATPYCTSLARTDDFGRTWTGVSAPVIGPADGATGVSQVRFLNLSNGWAFGPQLYATHDGGRTWAPVDTHGLRVTDLETVGDRAFALFASCQGSGPIFAAGCTSFTLYSSPAGTDSWAPVGAATSGLTGGGPGSAGSAASLALTGSRGFLLAPNGTLYSGPVDGSGPWTRAGALASTCSVGSAQPDGQPSGALLAAASGRELIAACVSPSGSGHPKLIYSSPNAGASWIQIAPAPVSGVAYSVAASPSETVVLGTSTGIDLLPAGDVTWQAATLAGPAPAAGFGYVGMTTDKQGIALPADPTSGAVWFTVDGGQTWRPSSVSGS